METTIVYWGYIGVIYHTPEPTAEAYYTLSGFAKLDIDAREAKSEVRRFRVLGLTTVFVAFRV